MVKIKTSEMNSKQKQGRQNKNRGYATEKQLVNFLNTNGILAERVILSGRMKHLKSEKLKGDVNIRAECGLVHVEVKSRQKLPAYVTGIRNNMRYNVKEVENLCFILTDKEFLDLCKNNTLPTGGLIINIAKCKQLLHWFQQDNADIIAMKEYGKRTWYFAIHVKSINKIGGEF